MIFPFLRGFVLPHLAPVTYFLLAVNFFVWASTLESYERADKKIDALLTDHAFLHTQGAAFAVMIGREPDEFSITLRGLGRQAIAGDREAKRLLGGLALRNVNFMNRALEYDFGGDEIALKGWREKFKELQKGQSEHPSYQWGISRLKNEWRQWLSYQFAHSGGLHLFWNMVFLLLFGCFVETQLGSSFVILTYLGGGLLGAGVFSAFSGISSAPLVGASAAVSGLMGLVAFAWWGKERVKFFFWLLPVRGYYGFALLPSWLVLVVSIVPDLSGYLAASKDFGSVAYAAHLGGAAFGAIIAALVGLGVMKKEVEDESESFDDESHHSDAA